MIVEKLEYIKRILDAHPLIETSDLIIERPLTTDEISAVESKMKFSIPETLKDIYVNEGSSIEFKWFSDKIVFGPKIKMGEINLLNPNAIVEMYEVMNELIESSKTDLSQSNEEIKTIITDWTSWIPIIKFANGDVLCIDIRNMKVVFFEHDAMDGGSNIHGLVIAASIGELFDKWGKLAFVNPFDWSDICDSNGINMKSELIVSLSNFISTGTI